MFQLLTPAHPLPRESWVQELGVWVRTCLLHFSCRGAQQVRCTHGNGWTKCMGMKTVLNCKAFLKPSLTPSGCGGPVWSLACPTLQQRRDTEGQPQLTVLQPLPLLAARKRSPAPQSHPSQHIFKSKKKNIAFCITYLAKHL